MDIKEKVLVTGASGFVGSSLVDSLIEKAFYVVVLSRRESRTEYIKLLIRKYPSSIENHVVNWNEPSYIEKIVGQVDYIIHCAGVTSALNEKDYYSGNVLPTIALLEAASKSTKLKRIVFISSQAATGPAIAKDKVKIEEDKCNPISNYGLSKKIAEEEILKYKDKFPITILRPSAIYGPRDTEFYPIFRLAKLRLSLIVGNGKKSLNLIYIKDFVHAIIISLGEKKRKYSLYFVTDGFSYDWISIYKTLREVFGKKSVVTIKIPEYFLRAIAYLNTILSKINRKPRLLNTEKAKEMMAPFWLCSSGKIEKELKFKAKYPLYEGFRETYLWYKKKRLI